MSFERGTSASYQHTDKEGYTQTLEFIQQNCIQEQLTSYFNEEISFNELKPFIVENVHTTSKNGGSIYLGQNQEKVYWININPELKTIFSENRVVAIPQNSRDDKYHWYSFHIINPETGISDSDELFSVRINKDKRTLERLGWFGEEQTRLLDFLDGDEKVKESDLQPFSFECFIDQSRRNKIDWLRDNTLYRINFNLHTIPKPITEGWYNIKITPHYDVERDYTWLDGFITTGEEELHLFSKRIKKGEKHFLSWKGPDIQAFIDWTDDILDISKIRPLRLPLNEKAYFSIDTSVTKKLDVLLDYKLSPDKRYTVLLVPRQDEVYKWIDTYVVSEDGREKVRFIESARVMKEKNRVCLSSRWPGSERQRYVDYLNGELDFQHLPPIIAETGTASRVQLFSLNRHPVAIHFYKNMKNEKIMLFPSQNTDGKLLLSAYRFEEKQPFSTFIYNEESHSFLKIDDNAETVKKPNHYWTEETIEKEIQQILDKGGDISEKSLKEQKRHDLALAIYKKYPGRWARLRSKFKLKSEIEIDNFCLNPETTNSELPVIEYKSKRYIDDKGRAWVTAGYFYKKHSQGRVERRLEKQPYIRGISSGRERKLYLENETSLLLERTRVKKEVSQEDADAALQSLFE